MFLDVALRAKVLIGIALGCTGYVMLMPDDSQTIEPVRSRSTPRSAHDAHGAASARKSPIVNPSFRMSDRIVKDAAAAALFSAHSWYVAPPPPPPAPVAVPAPLVPTAPPLPFAFMGSYRTEREGQTYFLMAGDRVYDVRVGDTLDNTYSVDGVRSGQLLLTYMPLNIQQALAVGDDE